MAAECRLNPTAVVRRVAEIADSIAASLEPALHEVRAMPAGDHPILEESAWAIRERCWTVLCNLDAGTSSEPHPEEPHRVMSGLEPSGG